MAETRLITFWGGKCRDEVNYPLPFTSYFWRTRRAVCNPGILIACDTLAFRHLWFVPRSSGGLDPGTNKQTNKKDWIPALHSSGSQIWSRISVCVWPCDGVTRQDVCWPYGNTAMLAGCRCPGVRRREELTNQHSWAALRAFILEWLVKITVHILCSISTL